MHESFPNLKLADITPVLKKENATLLKNYKPVGFLPVVSIHPTFQRRINVVDQRWNNVDPTCKMKQNPASDFQRWYNVDTTSVPTVNLRKSLYFCNDIPAWLIN